mgnify:CR=1 FL=1
MQTINAYKHLTLFNLTIKNHKITRIFKLHKLYSPKKGDNPVAAQPNKVTITTKLFAHLETMRPYTVIWCGLVSLAGACLSWGQLPPLDVAILSLLVPIIGWIAGLYLSDFLDRKLDKIEKPHRPIPSGRIKPYEAIFIGIAYAAIGGLFSLYLGLKTFFLVFIVALLVFTYAYITKSHGILGNLNRGSITVVAYFYGIFSTNIPINDIPTYIFLLSFVFLLHDTNSNLVGAIRDIEGDKKANYKTIPVKFGIKKSIFLSMLLSISWLSLLLSLIYYFDFLSIHFYYMMFLDILILISFYIYFFHSRKNYSRDKALRYHEFFVIERITLASALLFGKIDFFYAIVIYAAALSITVFSQYSLRKRYEFVEYYD